VSEEQLSVVEEAGVWCLRGSAVDEVGLVNEFLVYLADRNFSPRTCRAYSYDLLAFMRWLVAEGIALTDVDVDVMLRFLTACPRSDTTGTSRWQRVFDPRRPQHRLRARNDQPQTGGDLVAVCVPRDARARVP
jgi:hypothetical protein